MASPQTKPAPKLGIQRKPVHLRRGGYLDMQERDDTPPDRDPNKLKPWEANNTGFRLQPWEANNTGLTTDQLHDSGVSIAGEDEYKYAKGGEVKAPPKLGMVRGKGTATSDSIPAKLSDGEFVIPANVVKAYGPEFFNNLIAKVTGQGAPKLGEGKEMCRGGKVHAAIGLNLTREEEQNPLYINTPPVNAPTIENAASQAQTQRSLDNPRLNEINTTYPAYSGQNAIVGGGDLNRFANNVVAPVAKGSEALMRGVAGLIPDEAEKAARHAVLADKANQVKEAVSQTAGQIPELLIGRGGIEAGKNIGNAVIGTGQGVVRNAQADIANNPYGITGVPYSLAKGAATRLYDTMAGDQNTPATVQQPVINAPQTQQQPPSIQKQVTEPFQEQQTEKQRTQPPALAEGTTQTGNAEGRVKLGGGLDVSAQEYQKRKAQGMSDAEIGQIRHNAIARPSVIPWDNPLPVMTEANMGDFTPEYINAVTNAREQKANQEVDKESNAIDRQYKLGLANRRQANEKDEEPAFKAEDLEMLPETSNTERARIKTLKKAHMAALQNALANGTPEEEGSILKEFSQASGISLKTLQEMLRR